MQLKKFTNFRSGSRLNVSLRVNQGLFISNMLLNKHMIINAKFAHLFIDDNKRLLAIHFLSEEDEECKKISLEKSGVSINIASVMRYFDIKKLRKRKHLDCKFNNNMLIIDLSIL